MSKKNKKHLSGNGTRNVEVFNFAETDKNQSDLMEESSGKTNKMKNKFYNLALLIGVGLIVGSLVMKNNSEKDNQVELAEDEEVQVEEVTENVDGVEVVLAEDFNGNDEQLKSNYLEGLLTLSDDVNRGSLKLVSDLGNIYLRTSRDFSKMVGLQVLVMVNGNLENFELLDIQPAVQKDGYILSQ